MNDERDDAQGLGPQLSDDLKRFAAELSRLRPRDDRLDREHLAFLAGRASVAAGSARRMHVLGLPLESRVWPAAFASMTTIAAALLFALLVRPESPGLHQMATNDRIGGTLGQIAIERVSVDGILTTRDAHLGDIQTRLANRDLDRMDSNASLLFAQPHDVSILTPQAWHQVINDAENSKPSSDDSSSLFQIRGVLL
jgi:hypothetical protein